MMETYGTIIKIEDYKCSAILSKCFEQEHEEHALTYFGNYYHPDEHKIVKVANTIKGKYDCKKKKLEVPQFRQKKNSKKRKGILTDYFLESAYTIKFQQPQ